jgi:hypothetical protein
MYVSWLTRDLLDYHHLYFVIGEGFLVHMEVMGLSEIQKKPELNHGVLQLKKNPDNGCTAYHLILKTKKTNPNKL